MRFRFLSLLVLLVAAGCLEGATPTVEMADKDPREVSGDPNPNRETPSGEEVSSACVEISCPTGTECRNEIDQARCVDLDECADSNACPDGSVCVNHTGGFQCVDEADPCANANCDAGTKCEVSGLSHVCSDIDECADEGICPQGSICENTVGSYLCNDIDECADGASCPVGQSCVNEDPGYRCEGESVPGDPGCGLPNAAFCETFDAASPGGRGGDVDEANWSVSRWGNLGTRIGHRGNFARLSASSNAPYIPGGDSGASLCGSSFSDVGLDEDFRVCNGRLEEVLRDDGNAFTINSMMARKPFDFANRTGTVVFDVDAKLNTGHGWWVELWISEEPQPVPYQFASSVNSLPKKRGGHHVSWRRSWLPTARRLG